MSRFARVLALCWLLAGAQSAFAAERILALSPHVCEILFAVGAGDSVVGVVDYCDEPKAAEKRPHVGSYAGIHAEAALKLHPDVAVVMSHNVKGVALLEKAGVRIVESHPASLEEVFADILLLGRLAGRKEEAERLVAGLKRRLAAIRSMKKAHVRVFYELWFDPLLTAGGKSFINDLLKEAGADNVFADVPLETPQVSIESVVRAAPDVVIVPLENRDLGSRRQFWKRWLPGARIIGIDPDLLHRPGPRLIDGLEELQRRLNEVSR